MKTLIILAVFAIAMAGCKREAIHKEQKGDFELELLFEKDGCKIYRFYDGRYVYWSNCEGKVSYQEIHRSGKTSYTVNVESLTNTHHP